MRQVVARLLVQVIIRKRASCCKERPRWAFRKRKNNSHLGNQFYLTLSPKIQASDAEKFWHTETSKQSFHDQWIRKVDDKSECYTIEDVTQMSRNVGVHCLTFEHIPIERMLVYELF